MSKLSLARVSTAEPVEHQWAFSTEHIVVDSLELRRLLEYFSSSSEYNYSICLSACHTQAQVSLEYCRGTLKSAVYKGDGLCGFSIPQYISSYLFPKQLIGVDKLCIRGYITLEKGDASVQASEEIIFSLRDPSIFAVAKSRVKFVAIDAVFLNNRDLSIVEAVDAIGDEFNTNIHLSVSRQLSEAIANFYDQCKSSDLHLDSFLIREVNYSDLIPPWESSSSIVSLRIPFTVIEQYRQGVVSNE